MFRLDDRIGKRNFARAQRDRMQAQFDRVDAQLHRLRLRSDIDVQRVKQSPYASEYVVGMLDAITKMYESETRRRIGIALHEAPFVAYAATRLACTRDEARARFLDFARDANNGARPKGFLDGYADGVAALYAGHAPQRLIDHFVSAAEPKASNLNQPTGEALAS